MTAIHDRLRSNLQDLEDLPKPHKEGLVKLKQHPERFYASVSFSGAFGGIQAEGLR